VRSRPTSNELHDFLAGLDKTFRVGAPNLSAYLNEIKAS
jgi:hypothetical protein